MTRPSGALLGAVLAAAVAACTTLPRAPPLAIPAAQLDAFQLTGRINLRVQGEGFPGRVRWMHTPARDELWFYSPAGTAVAHLREDEHGARLVDARGDVHRAADLHTLTAAVLGWDLPLDGLPYWVRGLPWPQADTGAAQRDAAGRLSRLEQAGWQVSYLAWSGSSPDALPAKLDLQGERLRLRLVVDRWEPVALP